MMSILLITINVVIMSIHCDMNSIHMHISISLYIYIYIHIAYCLLHVAYYPDFGQGGLAEGCGVTACFGQTVAKAGPGRGWQQ